MYDVIGLGVPVTDIFVTDANSASFTLQDPEFKRSYIALATGSKSQVQMKIRTGGSSANTCAALAKLKYKVGYFGLLGTGHYSDLLARDLMERGVDVSHFLRIQDYEIGTSLVVSSSSGDRDRAILTDYGSGQNIQLNEEHFRHFKGFLIDTKWLDITSLKPDSTPVLRNFLKELYHEKERPQIFFAPSRSMIGPAKDIVREIISYVDVLTLNDSEALKLTGMDRLDDAIHDLHARNVKQCFITRGGAGIMYKIDETVYTVNSVRLNPDDIINTTGAGDTVAAFFLDGLLRGLETEELLKRATAAGAMKITHPVVGAKEGVPTTEELDEYLKEHEDSLEVRSFPVQ